MNGISNYGMTLNSQVNFQGKKTASARKTLKMLKTHKIQTPTVKLKEIEKQVNTKTDEIMSKLKEGQITYSEALDALINLESSIKTQIKRFEAYV